MQVITNKDYIEIYNFINYKLYNIKENIKYVPNNSYAEDTFGYIDKLMNEISNIISFTNYYTIAKNDEIKELINKIIISGFDNSITHEFIQLVNTINITFGYERI